MKSAWFWGQPQWQDYLKEYAKTRPECLYEWKTSPLANDHDFTDALNLDATGSVDVEWSNHQSQVIDLRIHKWSDIRKSYRGLINKALKEMSVDEYGPEVMPEDMGIFKSLHARANNGQPRNDETYKHQYQWMKSGNGLLVMCTDWPTVYAAAYWIIYNKCAYYMSGPSIKDGVQHAVIWKSLQILKARKVELVEMGQIDGKEEGTRGVFKTGFGGEAKPFMIVRYT